jgi:hypothetical protein
MEISPLTLDKPFRLWYNRDILIAGNSPGETNMLKIVLLVIAIDILLAIIYLTTISSGSARIRRRGGGDFDFGSSDGDDCSCDD